MRFKNFLLISVLTLFIADFSHANSSETISIALFTDKSSVLDKSPFVSQLEVGLSQKEGIRLLERAAIDKILDEQKLSAAGLLDRNNSIKIGKLLRADAFIILSLESKTQDANDLIRVRVSETAHGLRLLDYFEQSDSKNPKGTIERIIKKLEAILKKINQPDEKLIPIGIVDIHRVQLGEQYKMLERTLPVMLSVRLSLEPQIIMLEREDLKVLLDEKLRTEGEDTKFWNSAILIEGYIQPNNGHLEMHLSLKQAAGAEIKSLIIPVEPNEPSLAIAQVTTEIIQQLQNSPPAAKWQPELEAEQFYKQGQFLSAHSRYEDSIPLFEIAHVLQPQNIYYTKTLFENIWRIRTEIEEVLIRNRILAANIKKTEQNHTKLKLDYPALEEPRDCPYTDIEIVELLSVFVRQIQSEFEKGNLSTREIYEKFSRCLGTGLMGNSGYFTSSVSVATEQIRLINRENRKIWVETFNKALKKQLIRNDYPGMNNLIKTRLVWISADNAEELIANLKEAFKDFVMPPELGGKIASAQERDLIFEQAFLLETKMITPFNIDRTHLKDDNRQFLKLWQEFIKELDKYDNAYVSSKGRLAIARGIRFLPDPSQKIQATNSSLKTVRDMADKLTSPDGNLDSKTKKQLITDIKNMLLQRSTFGSADERFLIWEDIYVYFIEQKDIDSLISLGISAFRVEFGYKQETGKKSYHILDLMTEVLQTRKDNKQVNSILAQIKDFQNEIRQRFVEFKSTQETSTISVTMLFTEKDWLEQGTFPEYTAQVQDEILWFAMVSNSSYGLINPKYRLSYFVGLAGINLKNKKIISLWHTTIYHPNRPSKISGLVITEKTSYISLQNVGILEFPGSQEKGFAIFIEPNTIPRGELEIERVLSRQRGIRRGINYEKVTVRTEKKPKLYTEQNGLPSLLITAIAKEKNKFWIAYGDSKNESGLGIYDPNTESWKAVFCSTLKNGTPFSNSQPYEINSMVITYPNKLFFNVSDIEQKGLWKLDTATRETKLLQPISGILNEDLSGSLLLQSSGYLCKIDPLTEKITLNIRPSLNLIKKYPQSARPIFGLEEEMFLPESFLEKIDFGPYSVQGNLDFSTGTIYHNKLWARFGKSQILIVEKGKSFNEAQIIDNNILEGKPVYKFVSTPYGLIGIGEGTVGLIETEK